MNKILVTGATGHLGELTVRALLERTNAQQIVALARDPSKAQALADLGIEVRQGDYFDKKGLELAFQGIEKLFLVSAVAFTDRHTQHENVIAAAKAAGVKHIVFTSVQHNDDSAFVISMVTESDRATEQALKDSGLAYTILRNNLYLDALPFMFGTNVLTRGLRLTAGSGNAAMVARSDLADANAVVLTQAGHENKTYSLGADQAVSFAEIAACLGDLSGAAVPLVEIRVTDYIAERVAEGLPEPVAAFLHEWVQAVNVGDLSAVTGDLRRLIGRAPRSYRDFLSAAFFPAAV